ncbi:MAG: CBS domain-containing protein [Candidatus Bathyarchaeia archaeon]
MSSPVRSISPDVDARSLVREMNRHKIASMLVVDDGKPVGIVTERDILQRVIDEGRDLDEVKAREIMSSPVHCIDHDMPISEACKTMAMFRVKRLVVVKNKRPIGIVTITDLIKRILAAHAQELEDWERALLEAWETF